MIENKKMFVKQFEALLKSTAMFSDVKRLDYYKDDKEESIYVTYESNSQKRINVHMDSCGAMMADFFKQIDIDDWVIPIKKFED